MSPIAARRATRKPLPSAIYRKKPNSRTRAFFHTNSPRSAPSGTDAAANTTPQNTSKIPTKMSRSRSLFHEFSPFFRLMEHYSHATHPHRLAARFIPAAGCSTAHVGRHSATWNHHHMNPWRSKIQWGWGWDAKSNRANSMRPAIDVVEKADAYVIEVDLPGVKKGEVSVSVGDDGWSLLVEGRRGVASAAEEKTDGNDATESGEQGPLLSERADLFTRKVWFPQTVDGRGVKAKLEDGVLKLHVPKKVEGDGSVRVEVA